MSLVVRIEADRGGFHLAAELEAGAEEIVAVAGPNGSGKSTLIEAVAGTVPARGRIELEGEVLLDSERGIDVPLERRRIGVVFQDVALFPHMSALDNVAFAARVRGDGPGAARATALRWLEATGARGIASRRASELSGGQAQRVALARALASRPRALLLDEPLAAIDAADRPVLRRLLRAVLGGFKGPKLVVTHEVLDAAAVADRVCVVEDGRVIQSGTLAELRTRPRSPYVAGMLGSNLLHGTAEGELVRCAGAVVHTAERASGQVFVSFPASAVALFRERPRGSPRNCFRLVVASLDARLERAHVVLTGELDMVADVTPQAVRELGLAPGVEVWAAVKATEISVYPA